jgi:hypothetical protein
MKTVWQQMLGFGAIALPPMPVAMASKAVAMQLMSEVVRRVI